MSKILEIISCKIKKTEVGKSAARLEFWEDVSLLLLLLGLSDKGYDRKHLRSASSAGVVWEDCTVLLEEHLGQFQPLINCCSQPAAKTVRAAAKTWSGHRLWKPCCACGAGGG